MGRRARKSKVSSMNKVEFKPSVTSSKSVMFNPSVSAVRILYLHIGTYKTGSTALQDYLAVNTSLLLDAGISYEFPPGCTDHSIKNGQFFYDQLYNRSIPVWQLEKLLESYFSGRTVAICSSEDFTKFKFQEWQQVINACQRLEIQVKIVMFIRDIGPYYHSVYGQLVKFGEYYPSFGEFCKKDQYITVINSLKCLLDLFGRDSMSVIHYESAIDNIDTAFMEILGLSSELFNSLPLKSVVNRSLTGYELEILSHVSEAKGTTHAPELSNLLTSKRPHLKPEKYISQDIILLLMNRHIIDVDWLNQTFFGGTDVIKIFDKSRSNPYDNALSAEDRQAIDRDVADWAISQLQSIYEKCVEDIADRLRAIDWENAGNPIVPDDFDPFAYLLLNTDVLRVGIPPYGHFIVSGQHENWRRWKWTN